MKKLQLAGPALAGICAAVVVVSLSGCHAGTGSAAGAPGTSAPTTTTHATGTGQDTGAPVTVRTVRATGTRHRAMVRRITIPGRALDNSDAIAVTATGVWVASSAYEDGGRGWLTELSATTGALLRVVASRPYDLTDPQALAVDGNALWVADGFGNALTEINATTGALIRVVAGQGYEFADPAAVAADGGSVWVANGGSDSVTEVNAATGALIRVISGPQYRLNTTVYSPAIAVAGNHVWVPDANGNAVTEIDATTGALIRVISGRGYQLNGPDAIAVAGNRIWVLDVDSNAVTEIDATTGALIRVIPSLPNVPFAITAGEGGVWLVTNLGEKAVDGSHPHGSVAELSATTGQLVRNISRSPFRSGSPGGEIASYGGHVWVAGTSFYSYRGWVAELSAATGALVRVITS